MTSAKMNRRLQPIVFCLGIFVASACTSDEWRSPSSNIDSETETTMDSQETIDETGPRGTCDNECPERQHETEETCHPPEDCFTSISAGETTTCALDKRGGIQCWGTGSFYSDIPESTGFKAISVGTNHLCALNESDSIQCWGTNNSGEVQDKTGDFKGLSTHTKHTCGLNESGKIRCWGANNKAQLDAPNQKFEQISVGYNHTCGLLYGNDLTCWGGNSHSQLIDADGNYTQISAGYYSTCFLGESGIVNCSGKHFDSLLSRARWEKMSLGDDHVVGLLQSNELHSLGTSEFGEVVSESGTFIDIATGIKHTCAINESHKIQCWGKSALMNHPE